MTSGKAGRQHTSGKTHPHLQWQAEMGAFAPRAPTATPKVVVQVTILDDAHKSLGGLQYAEESRSAKSCIMEAIADTGCQTCTAGQDMLVKLGCKPDLLVKTRHRIVGITDASLTVAGALMLNIEFKGHTTRQMVHISTNITGLYLSESALKDLTINDHQ
jgi:hypothetical protein